MISGVGVEEVLDKELPQDNIKSGHGVEIKGNCWLFKRVEGVLDGLSEEDCC